MKPDRRKFFQTFGAGAAGIGLTSALPLSSCASSSERESTNEDDQILFIGDDIAVVETEYGKVKGFILRNIYQFRGIPYGADSGGKHRFMTPPNYRNRGQIFILHFGGEILLLHRWKTGMKINMAHFEIIGIMMMLVKIVYV